MKIKSKNNITTITWDNTSPVDLSQARIVVQQKLKTGWSCWSCARAEKMGEKFFRNNNSIELFDQIRGALLSYDLFDLIRLLADLGLSPILSTRGTGKKAVFRFHVDRARNWWHDSKNLEVAVKMAVKLWMRSDRPIY